jgi:hypothetical protein
MHKAELDRFFSESFDIFLSVSFHRCSVYTYVLSGTMDKVFSNNMVIVSPHFKNNNRSLEYNVFTICYFILMLHWSSVNCACPLESVLGYVYCILKANSYRKSWLIRNSIIRNFAIFRILVWTYVPRKKNS